MKRATLLVPILAAALTLPVFAQAEREVKTGGKGKEETLKLMINGGLDVAFAYDSEQLRESGHYQNGGFGPANNVVKEPYYYFNGPAWISFWASLQDNVEMNITLRTVPFNNDTSVQAANANNGITDRLNWGDNSTQGVIVKYAYMRIKELFDPAWSLSIGVMDFIWDVRGRGNAFFLDVANSESPWGEISRAWATTVRTQEYPIGWKVSYTRDQFSFEMALAPVVHDADARFGAPNHGASQEGLYYLDGIYNIDNQGSRAGMIMALFHGTNPSDNVFTIGFSGVLVPQKDIEVFGEAYIQMGQAWSKNRTSLGNALVHTRNGDQEAFAFLTGARLDVPGETAAYVELHMLYVSGQNMRGTANGYDQNTGFQVGAALNKSREFMSYENYDVMLLLNSNEWGFDFDNNIWQIDAQGGVMLSTGGSMKNNLHFILKIAYAGSIADWKAAAVATVHPDRRVDIYGFEIDFTVRWFMNKNANIYWSIGYLAGSDIIELFNRDRDSFAWVSLLGIQVSH